VRAVEGPDPKAPLQDPHPGRDWRQGHREGNDRGTKEGRDGEMLWRRCDAEAEAPGEAEGGEEEDAGIRLGEHSAGGVYSRAADG